MRRFRRAQDRGQTHHDGVDVRHTFSTGQYLDPRYMGFGPLRALDEECMVPGAGYATREYANMERVTLVLEGELDHRDNLGPGVRLTPGDAQCVTCGTGVRFSVHNASESAPLHSYTAWFIPGRDDLNPAYQNASFLADCWDGDLVTLASPDGRDGSLTLSRNVFLYGASIAARTALDYRLDPERGAWLQVIDGTIEMSGESLSEGDGVEIVQESSLTIKALSGARLFLFDLDI